MVSQTRATLENKRLKLENMQKNLCVKQELFRTKYTIPEDTKKIFFVGLILHTRGIL
jgi:hypothetical protein